MLEKVFSHLVPRDLNTVMLVCKTWNNVAEASPSLWSWVKIRNLSQLSLKRLQGAPEIAIEGFPKGPWRELLQAVLQRPGLKKLSWGLESRFACDTPLAAAEADLLTQFFSKMEEIEIWSEEKSGLESGQVATRYMVDSVLQRSSNLKRLSLRDAKWHKSVNPVRLASALNKIEALVVGLSEEQANLLFKTMKDGTSIKSLCLSKHLTLSKLEPTHLFSAFDKLRVLLLDNEAVVNVPLGVGDNVPLQLEMVTTLCETVAAGTNLKELSLADGHLSQVNPHLLGRMATQMAKQLERLYLHGNIGDRSDHNDSCYGMKNQIGKIVEAIAITEAKTLKILHLNGIDFSLVDGRVLARMTTRVEELELGSDLNEDQTKAISETIALGPGRLKQLAVSTSLNTVDADVLARAVNNLECFESDSVVFFSIQQMQKILSRALESTSLKTLKFSGDRGLLDPKLLSEAQKNNFGHFY